MELIADDGRPVAVGTPRRRALLGYLLWRANQVVSIDAVTEALWGGAPPATAQAQIRSDVSALRRSLRGAACAIESRPGAYILVAHPADVDSIEFADLVAHASAAADPSETAAGLRAALELWRGEPFGGIRASYVESARIFLREQKLHVYDLLAEAELRLGRHLVLVAELSALVAEHPLRERLRTHLMMALHRSGRTAEALASARDWRKLLADQQGLDPGSAIVDLERRLLRAEPSTVPAPASTPVPAELPAALASFVGRRSEWDELDALTGEAKTALAVRVVVGPPGAGKTTLAIQWGHSMAASFPDGRLYVNLRGFDPVGVPVTPSEALRGFLLALGVVPQGIPAGLDAQAALYRSLTHGRRILVVLDNGRDEQQVRPLLPGGGSAAVVITSRRTLAGLVATSGARIIHLGQLSFAEARELLAVRIGRSRAAAEPQALDSLVESCARLPLALCIAASRAAAKPTMPLRSIADGLRARAGGLDALTSNDVAIDVRAVFAASYRWLSPTAGDLFRRLSLHAGPDIGRAVMTGLAGENEAAVDTALDELVDASLITETPRLRYACHDLLRAYAAELAHAVDPPHIQAASQRRIMDYYTRTAEAASTLLNPHRLRLETPPVRPDDGPPVPEDRDQAQAWFAAEHLNILAAAEQAGGVGLDEHVWHLALAASTYFDLHGYWHDWISLGELAIAAAERRRDRLQQAHMHHNLAIACHKLGQDHDTDRHIEQAIRAFRDVRDPVGQAHALSSRSRIAVRRGRHAEALDSAQDALALFVKAGDLTGQATAHNAACASLLDLGRLDSAWEHANESLRLFSLLEDRRSEADAWDSVGCVHQRRGEYAEAIRCFEQAHKLWRHAADRLGEAVALSRLGDAMHATGDTGAAAAHWSEALPIMDDLRRPEAATLRAALARLQISGL